MRKAVSFLTLAFALALGCTANADILLYDFGAPELPGGSHVDLGATHTFSAKSPANPIYTIDAAAVYIGAGTNDGPHLFQKNDGSNESGLGIRPDKGSDTEIDVNHAVDLNFTTLKSLGTISSIVFKVGSTQADEGFLLTGYDSHGVGTVLKDDPNHNGSSNLSYTATTSDIAKFSLFGITTVDGNGDHPNANIVLETVTVNLRTVPEPASMALMFGGMTVFGLYKGMRRVRQVNAA